MGNLSDCEFCNNCSGRKNDRIFASKHIIALFAISMLIGADNFFHSKIILVNNANFEYLINRAIL